MDSLVLTNEQVTGVEFSAAFKSTVLLEGTFDHSNWTGVAYLWGNAGTTTWTTNVALNDFGSFFRLQLVAHNEHVTNLPPLNAASPSLMLSDMQSSVRSASTYVPVEVSGCFPEGDEMVVKFVSKQGAKYLVQATDLRGNALSLQTITTDEAEGEARFQLSSLPDAVLFKVEIAN